MSTEQAPRGLVSTDARAREPRKPVAATRLGMTGHLSRDGLLILGATREFNRVRRARNLPRGAARDRVLLTTRSARAAHAALLGVERTRSRDERHRAREPEALPE